MIRLVKFQKGELIDVLVFYFDPVDKISKVLNKHVVGIYNVLII